MPKFFNALDLTSNQLLNAKLQNLGADITAAGTTSTVFYNSTSNLAKISNGTSIDTLTNLLESVAGSGAISVSGIAGKSQTISIAAASGAVPGTMSAADFSKLGAATAANTFSTIVLRDASGNFSATTITAALTGTASNATNLNGQAASWYLDRTNHTGTQAASTISNFDAQVNTHTVNQLTAPTADFAMNTHKITGLVDPTNAQDAATKNYVDSFATGLDVKASVRAATTADIATGTYNATGGAGRGQFSTMPNTLDGVTLAANDRVLIKNQATGTGAANGIWVVTTPGSGANGVWNRAADFDQDAEVTAGAFTFVEEGTVNGDAGFTLTTNNPITIGGASGTVLAFAQFSGAGTYTAGNGLALAGGSFSVTGTTNRISVSGAGVDISSSYVGQASITTLGTITTGTWTGTTIALANGGTGATTAAAAKTNLSFTTKTAGLLSTSATSYTIAHGMGAITDMLVQVIEVATGNVVFPDVSIGTTNVVITFAVAPAANAYRYCIIG